MNYSLAAIAPILVGLVVVVALAFDVMLRMRRNRRWQAASRRSGTGSSSSRSSSRGRSSSRSHGAGRTHGANRPQMALVPPANPLPPAARRRSAVAPQVRRQPKG